MKRDFSAAKRLYFLYGDHLKQFGDIDSVEMIPPGSAKVRFVNQNDAERAKNALEGTIVEGYGIIVEYV